MSLLSLALRGHSIPNTRKASRQMETLIRPHVRKHADDIGEIPAHYESTPMDSPLRGIMGARNIARFSPAPIIGRAGEQS